MLYKSSKILYNASIGIHYPDIEIQNDHEKDLLSVLVIPFRFGGFGWLPTRADNKSFLLVKGVYMNDLTNEKTMTTKELAEILGVDVRTVQITAKRILDLTKVLSQSTNGRPTQIFNEQQATLIKQEIQKHHNLTTRQIDSVTTEQEENQTIANAITILQRRANEYKKRAEIAENALSRIANGKGCFSMNQTAKALKLPFGNIKLFEKLRNERILNSDNTPKQEHINAEHFKTIVKFVNDKVGNKSVTLVTGKGLIYLAKKLNTEIDTSIQPDIL